MSDLGSWATGTINPASFLQPFKGFAEVGGPGGFKNFFLAGARMREGELSGVEHLAWRRVAGLFAQVLVGALAVGRVADDGMADVFEIGRAHV